jgi:tRNA threonylcarbamoyladenosine biosynthesis protein TsaE
LITTESLRSKSPEETIALGEKIGCALAASGRAAGSIICLQGPLGAGKTCLVKGIAHALGIRETITSPTYTIVSEYQSAVENLALFHIDAYRLAGSDDFEAIGGIELLSGNALCIIEWSERIADIIPETAIRVEIRITADGAEREITILNL